jgi:hypothetical protein
METSAQIQMLLTTAVLGAFLVAAICGLPANFSLRARRVSVHKQADRS